MRRTVLPAVLFGAMAALATPAFAQFPAASYSADKVFANGAPNQTPAGMAFDGSSYWSVDGGGNSGVRLARYDGAGSLLNTYSPGLDFRSVFTDAGGTVYARQYADASIYRMTAPGVFSVFATLAGGSLDAQSSVVFNSAQNGFLAMSAGVVGQWDLTGTFQGATSLIGFGTLGTESSYPQDRGIATLGSNWLTYDNGALSMWDIGGNRLGTSVLTGAGTTFYSNFSFSRADDGRVFIVDDLNGDWRGYQVGSATVVPEPGTVALLAAGLVGVFGATRRRQRLASH